MQSISAASTPPIRQYPPHTKIRRVIVKRPRPCPALEPKAPGNLLLEMLRSYGEAGAPREHGDRAFALLTAIALIWFQGHGDPIQITNHELMDRSGFRSIQTLRSARRDLERSGWLTYKLGEKGYAGWYALHVPTVAIEPEPPQMVGEVARGAA